MPKAEHSPGEMSGTAGLDQPGNGAKPGDLNAFFELVYTELRRLAHRRLRNERENHTLSTTALVHETYLKLSVDRAGATERERFFALAARAMRRILVDYARRRSAARRGGGAQRVSLNTKSLGDRPSSITLGSADDAEELLALDAALHQLAELDPRLAQVVELRFFGGLTEPETAAVVGLTPRTVARDWVKAKAVLRKLLTASSLGSGN